MLKVCEQTPFCAIAMSQPTSSKLLIEKQGPVTTVIINRPRSGVRRNAVDSETAQALAAAFTEFEADPGACAAVLTGAGGAFRADAHLKEIAQGAVYEAWAGSGGGPCFPSR